MITDEKGRIFGKINIVDLLAILIVVVSLAAVCFKFGFSAQKNVGSANDEITYVMKIKAIRETSADALRIGDNLTEKTTKKKIGKIIDKKVETAKEFVNMADGSLSEEVEIPDRYDVYITVKGSGISNDTGYFLDGAYQVGVFSNVVFSSKYIETTGIVTQIK